MKVEDLLVALAILRIDNEAEVKPVFTTTNRDKGIEAENTLTMQLMTIGKTDSGKLLLEFVDPEIKIEKPYVIG